MMLKETDKSGRSKAKNCAYGPTDANGKDRTRRGTDDPICGLVSAISPVQ
jgi:hypothetical protein